jgi:hypothetical protein
MLPIRAHSLAVLTAWLVLIAAVGPVTPASAEVTVKGDSAAWQEVIAAYRKLNTLPGYRMKTAMPGGQSMVLEVAQGGNAMHMTMQGSGGGMEMVRIGDQVRFRMDAPGAPPGWKCQGMPPMPRAGDPTSVQGTVEVARGPDAAIDGQPMRVYLYTVDASAGNVPPGMSSVKSTLYVSTESGLPRRVVVTTPRGDQALDYYDYGAPIAITLPPCGG